MTFDILLKKYFTGVVLVFVALAAYFQAEGATQLVGAALLGPASVSPALFPRAPLAPAFALSERPSALPLIERNPFDSVTGPLNAEKIPEGPDRREKGIAHLASPGQYDDPDMLEVGNSVAGGGVTANEAYAQFQPLGDHGLATEPG